MPGSVSTRSEVLTVISEMRTCLSCGKSIEHRRSTAKFCENSNCRARRPNRPKCSIENCPTQQLAKGYCRNHYEQLRRHGDPLYNGNRLRRKHYCSEGHLIEKVGRNHQGACRQCRSWQGTAAWLVMRWTEREFVERLAAQDNRCVICGEEFVFRTGQPRNKRTPCLDHCHKSGQGRGIICLLCNIGMGSFGDDPDRLEAAAAYLRRPLLEVVDVRQLGDRPV